MTIVMFMDTLVLFLQLAHKLLENNNVKLLKCTEWTLDVNRFNDWIIIEMEIWGYMYMYS